MKIISGFPDYAVTTEGEVFSLKWGKIRKLKQYETEQGYYKVWLYDPTRKRKMHMVHRLVAQAYIPNPANKPMVNHLDGRTKNNDLSNLEWATAFENDAHAREFLDKGKPYVATPEAIEKVKELRLQGLSTRKIAEAIDIAISSSTVHKICKELGL